MNGVAERVSMEELKTPKAAAAYLTMAWASGDQGCIREAVRMVAQAQAGVEDSIFQIGASGSVISVFA